MSADTAAASATSTPDGPPVPAPRTAPDPVEQLRAEVADLRRQLEVNDEEIDLLQVESAKAHRRWHRDPTVLTAVAAAVISVLSIFVSQYNVGSERDIQRRGQLTSLIQQLPAAQQTLREKPDSGIDGLLLVAGTAAQLMAQTESSSFEKIEVATALQLGGEFGAARQLALQALDESETDQATSLLESLLATRLVARLDFQLNDAPAGRDAYRSALDLASRPGRVADSPLMRKYQSALTEGLWAEDEYTYAQNCADAKVHLANTTKLYGPMVTSPSVKPGYDNLNRVITENCP